MVVICVVVVFSFISTQIFSKASKQPQYTISKATKNTIIEVVSETGTIAATGKTDVYSPTNGIIETIFVRNGDTVIEGQELFTIKSSATEQEKTHALASYLTAKNTLDTAQATRYSLQSTMFTKWNTFKNLAENDTYENSDGTPKYDSRSAAEYHVAEKDWLAAESNYKKQQAVISQAQAALSSTYLLYQATQNATVNATVPGTISNLSVTINSTVKVSSTASPTTPLATIANLSTTEVVVPLSENDIAKVKEGQEATIDVNAINDKIYKGIVRRVDTIGTKDQGVIRYNTYIEIGNADNKLRPGMNVDVVITTTTLHNVLSVPNSAIKPYQKGRAVRIPGRKNGEITYVPVVIGIKGKEKTQIIKGIEEGQGVITSLSNEQIKRPGLFGN